MRTPATHLQVSVKLAVLLLSMPTDALDMLKKFPVQLVAVMLKIARLETVQSCHLGICLIQHGEGMLAAA